MRQRETRSPRYFFRRHLRLHRTILASLLSLAIAGPTAAAAPLGQGLLLKAGEGWVAGLVMDSSVDIRVHGLLAEVRVRQVYRNDSSEWREARYLLPLPEQAAVAALRLQVEDRVIEGRIREKAEARAAYEAAAANGQQAALVEQNRPNLFRTSVANIGPQQEVEIELRYWQPVSYRDGEFSLQMPLTLTPRYTPGGDCKRCDSAPESLPASSAASVHDWSLPPSVSLRASIDAGLPLARVESASHAVAVQPQASGYRVELANLVERSDRDFVLRWLPEPSRAPRSAVFTETVDGEHYALVMLVPPTLPAAPLPRELILVIDTSGSMLGASMDQAKLAADRALARLRPGDRFNVIRFDDDSESLFNAPVVAEPANVAMARMFVRELQAEGGTEMLPALRQALQGETPAGYLRQVVLATDAAIGNEDELLQLIAQQRGEARVFPVGIGSAPNGWFLRKAAELGRGTETLIRDTDTVAAGMDALLARLDRPAMRNVQIAWPAAAEMYPAQVPDLYQGEALQVAVRLPQLAGQARISGLNPQPWQRALPLQGPHVVEAAGISRLWARDRIESLEDAMRSGGDQEALRADLLDTALRHQLVSRFTSLVALDVRARRDPGDALTSTQIGNDSPDGSLMLAQGSLGWTLDLVLAIALALLALIVARGRS